MSTMIQVTEPTMVLNEEVCKSNIARMAAKAKAANVVFRPHFKTHQSREIGEWFRASGVDKITVSSLNMAMKFAEWGWNDITVAFPVNCLEHEKINALAAKIRLNLLLVHSEGARQLSECLKYPVGVYLGVDTGYHRDGVDAGNYEKIERIMNIVAPDVNTNSRVSLPMPDIRITPVLKKKFCRFIKTICACLKISKKDILIAILSSRFL